MSDDSRALSQSAMLPSVDADYDAIHATIVATERGRWFLEQHTRRNRAADTELVLGAIERIELSIRRGRSGAPSGPAQSDLVTIAERINEARSDLIGRHGDPAASGDAALADLRNAVEQIQELVWDMHGRDGGSEFGAQLSLQTKRLTADGDRLERSLSSLRILLGLLDDLDQRLRQLADAPAPIANTMPSQSRSAAALLAAAEESEAATEPVSLLRPAEGLMARPLPPSDAEAPPVRFVEREPSPEMDERLTDDDARAGQPPEAAEFEPLWELPETASQPVEWPIETAVEPVPEAVSTDWTSVPNGREPEADDSAGSRDITPEPPQQSEHQAATAERPVSALEDIEAREYGRQDENASAAPSSEVETTNPAVEPVVQPELGDLNAPVPTPIEAMENVADQPEEPRAQESSGIFPGMPSEAPAATLAADEWIEVPAGNIAAADPMFDAELFDSDSDDDAGSAQAVSSPADPVTEEIDWLAADDDASTQDSAEEGAEPAELASLFADAAPASVEPAAMDLDADTPTESVAPAEPETPPTVHAFFDAAADPESDQPDPVSFLDALTESAEPEEPRPAEPMAEASLYAELPYDERAPSADTAAGRAYSDQPGGEPAAAESAPARPRYDWPATFARETADSPTLDRQLAGTRASAAYQALQPHPAAPSPVAAPQATKAVADMIDEAPRPLAQEDPDVPSVLERLENVRSAIATLMEEVNEKTAHREPPTSR
jgi:hypothetical protein